MNGLDRNGYAPSILQDDLTFCYRCGHAYKKLDRHEVFQGSNRKTSKAYGLWVMLCHDSCHLHGVHTNANEALRLKRKAQRVAMEHYGWTTEDFIRIFGKNFV